MINWIMVVPITYILGCPLEKPIEYANDGYEKLLRLVRKWKRKHMKKSRGLSIEDVCSICFEQLEIGHAIERL